MRATGQGAYVILGNHQKAHYMPVDQGGSASNSKARAANSSGIECYMGPIQGQSLQTIHRYTSRRLAGVVDDEAKPGSLFNAGGYIYSLDWRLTNSESELQYICMSVSLEDTPQTLLGEKTSSTPARVQIWSIDQETNAKLELVLCFDQGRISCVSWVPITKPISAGDKPVLGLMSACMQDGSVQVFAIPRPESVARGEAEEIPFLKLDSLVELNVKKGIPTAMEWCNADKLAVAYSDGWVSTWSLERCLLVGSKHARPLTFSLVSHSTISSISWDSRGNQVFVSAYDGCIRSMQLAHPDMSTSLHHSRGEDMFWGRK
jgi:WD40 repeat protein